MSGLVIIPPDMALTREEQMEIDYQRHDHSRWWDTASVKLAKFCRLAEAQNWRCCYCGCRMHFKTSEEHGVLDLNCLATREHVIPLSLYGRDTEANIVIACECCNHERGSIMTDDHWLVADMMGLELAFISVDKIEWYYFHKALING